MKENKPTLSLSYFLGKHSGEFTGIARNYFAPYSNKRCSTKLTLGWRMPACPDLYLRQGYDILGSGHSLEVATSVTGHSRREAHVKVSRPVWAVAPSSNLSITDHDGTSRDTKELENVQRLIS